MLRAISSGDVRKLISMPGLGKKLAERLILELKEKVVKKMMAEEMPALDNQQKINEIIREDVLSALINLGYKSNIAQDALDKVLYTSAKELAMDQLLKKTLKLLSG
jgi:Holliday junction DNA helicase RuvA